MNRKKIISIISAIVLSAYSGISLAEDGPMDLGELKKSLKNADGNGAISALLAQASGNAGMSARATALIDSSKNIGLQAGIAYENNRLKKLIELHSRNLDTIYNFSMLMVNSRVVPPVITETRDMYHQEGNNAIRLSGVMFKIEKQAYFSSVPPNWRGYVSLEEMSKNSIIDSAITIRPKGSDENSAWDEGLEIGFNEGRVQARKMIEHQFDELNRDFLGMFRFKKFAAQGKITMPIVANDRIKMTRTENTIALDEQLLQLTALPQFIDNIDGWNAKNSMVSSEIKPTDPRHKVPKLTDKNEGIVKGTDGFNPKLLDTPALKSHVNAGKDSEQNTEIFKDVR